MRTLDRLLGVSEQRFGGLSFDDWLSYFSFNGNQYPITVDGSLRASRLEPPADFLGTVRRAWERDGVAAAAVAARARLLSQVRFQWRSLVPGDNGRLFGTDALSVLEQPAGGITRQQLIYAAEQHVSLLGTAYFHLDDDGLRLLRPDWVTVVIGSDIDGDTAANQRDARIAGYIFKPGGPGSTLREEFIPPNEVASWSPEPDPVCWWRGSSWVQSVMSEILTLNQAQTFKSKFFQNGATPQMVVSLDPQVSMEAAKAYATLFRTEYEGAANAYKTIIMGGGADAKVVGSDLSQLDLKSTVGADENHIASRSAVPASILGTHLEGASLNAGNYQQLRRMWSDGWFSPTAQSLCATLERLVESPPAQFGRAELTYDPKAILFLQDDRKDEADVMSAQAQTLRQLVDAGYTPDSAREAVISGDFSRLQHSGLFSVQLQEAGQQPTNPSEQP